MSEEEIRYGLLQQIGPMRYRYKHRVIQWLPLTGLWYAVSNTKGETEEYVWAEMSLEATTDRVDKEE